MDINQKFDLFSEPWSPKLVASLNDHEVKLVKIKGEFVWHTHEDTDELFRWSMANSPSNYVIVTSFSDPVSCSWYHVELSIAPARTMRSRRYSSSQPSRQNRGRRRRPDGRC